MSEVKWKKWPIGKYMGYSLFIELPDNLNGLDHNAFWKGAEGFIERAFRNHDFLEELRNIIRGD